MLNKKLSFIIPIYNSENTILKSVNMIIKQKKKYPFEIILVDDGSTDQTGRICKSLSEQNNFIKYYKKENSGVSSARNAGIEFATGEWVYFIDADDELKNGAIEILFKLIGNTTSNIIFTGYDSIKETTSILKKSINKKTNILKLMTLDTKNLKKDKDINDIFLLWTCWGKLYRRDFLINNNIKFDEKLTLGEDILFLLNCYDFCDEVDINFSTTYYYNNYNISLSKGFNKKRIDNTKNLAIIYTEWAKKQTIDIQKSVEKFIIQRVLACISKYYLNIENNMKFDEKIYDFSKLCNICEIKNAIYQSKYSQFVEKKKTSLIYLISLFFLKKNKYDKLMKLYKFVNVY